MVNDRHPFGTPLRTAHAPDASYGSHTPYDQQDSSFGHTAADGYAGVGPDGHAAGYEPSFQDDPLFGAVPGGGHHGDGSWDTGAHQAPGYAMPGPHAPEQSYDHHTYATGAYPGHDAGGTGGWDTGAAWQSGNPADHGGHSTPAGGDSWQTGGWDTGEYGTTGAGPYETPGPYGAGQGYGPEAGYADGTGGYPTESHGSDGHGPDGHGPDGYGTGEYGAHSGHGAHAADGYGTGSFEQSPYDTGALDTGALDTEALETGSFQPYGAAGHDGSAGTGRWDTGDWQQEPSWGAGGAAPADGSYHPAPEADPERTAVFEPLPETADAALHGHGYADHPEPGQEHSPDSGTPADPYGAYDPADPGHTYEHEDGHAYEDHLHGRAYGHDAGLAAGDRPGSDGPAATTGDGGHGAEGTDGADISVLDTVIAEAVRTTPYIATGAGAAPRGHGSRRAGSPGRAAAGRGRRKAPAKRSALLTVAVPSMAVMGVAGIAAASVGGSSDDAPAAQAAPAEGAVKPALANNKLDAQLATLTADAGDFADRASRTQERIDLQERQAEEKRKKEEEAARKEALRPKFALPVAQHGLSAYYGQAGINWMSVHSGIDFPVAYGTPVMAATDGTVRTQYNIAYGNMAIVTAPDGTETWYCHLSSTKIRSGTVKAGDTIAYSGNSGNSTGPHLHFEVRPGGGSAIDPLGWFQSKGLDPQ
uniref:M23 family metallopeptidase n=1 Tax=Streptomyces zingiberis TaxID=2053010 RepID=UPI0035D446EB